MDTRNSLAHRFQQLRWKLTLSYTVVTIGAILAVALVLYVIYAGGLSFMIGSGYLPAEMIRSAASGYTPELRTYLAQSPPDPEAIAAWLERIRPAPYYVGYNINDADGLLVVDGTGSLLAISPPGYLQDSMIGQPLPAQALPGLADLLHSALGGEKDAARLYTLAPGGKIIMTVPVWDAGGGRVLGVLAISAAAPTLKTFLGDLVQILGISLLLSALVAGLIGTAFGSVAARGLVSRLNRLSKAALAWSKGDFALLVDDPSPDELGQLARRLNRMAEQLQNLMETQQRLALMEERNRLARDLHDSAKQQAFALAGQLGAGRALLRRDPEAAETHITEAERLAYELRQELTNLVQELRPAALQGQGLATVLREYAADWSRQAGVPVQVRVRGERPLPLEMEQNLFRIAQEALANASRHSQAKHVEILLALDRHEVALAVSDDGQGFDLEGKHEGMGLQSMRERAQSLGGTLSIESVPGQGTRISCLVPLDLSEVGEEGMSHE